MADYNIRFESTLYLVLRLRGGCFTADTPVLMADGSMKPIKQVQAGDLVLSFDVDKASMLKQEVQAVPVFDVHASDMVRLHIDTSHKHSITGLAADAAESSQSKIISCTSSHPFYCPSKQAWVCARPEHVCLDGDRHTLLQEGDDLVMAVPDATVPTGYAQKHVRVSKIESLASNPAFALAAHAQTRDNSDDTEIPDYDPVSNMLKVYTLTMGHAPTCLSSAPFSAHPNFFVDHILCHNSFQIYIKLIPLDPAGNDINGTDIITLDVEPSMMIALVEKKLRAKLKAEGRRPLPAEYTLVFAGKTLERQDTLDAYNISKESTLHAVVRRGREMGLAGGGKITQKINKDYKGLGYWNTLPRMSSMVNVYIVNAVMWREITGKTMPPTPVDAATYAAYKYPWFAAYDDGREEAAVNSLLAGVPTLQESVQVNDMTWYKREDTGADTGIDVASLPVVVITPQ